MNNTPNIDDIQRQDAMFRRLAATPHDPVKGLGCSGTRIEVAHPSGSGKVMIPVEMMADDDYTRALTDPEMFDRLRSRHDFEFWCVSCCKIQDKTTGKIVPLVLNNPQRYVAMLFEEDRRAGRPIRLIMLKARQWGGSTLVQMYMAWIQCTLIKNWNSLICAHVKDAAGTIRGMYARLLADYPDPMWLGDEGSKAEFRPYERSTNVREIPGRGCRVTIASSENYDAVRGSDYAMAHLSEVAFWSDTQQRSPADVMRAVSGSININPLTMVVMESTANGVGNFFHKEWLRACAGESDKRPVFIPWYYIDIYSTPVDDREKLLSEIDDYERNLIDVYGCTLEQVNWYHQRRKEMSDHSCMKAEYPTNDVEAFANTGSAVFAEEHINYASTYCREAAERGEMTGPVMTGCESLSEMRFVPDSNGNLSVWSRPVPDAGAYNSRYIAVVDVGGRSAKSDYSVIAVFDRVSHPGCLELVAQWRGHCDHDILAWKAAAIGRWYGNALLVYESNTLESDNTEGDPSLCILNDIATSYSNLYHRQTGEPGDQQPRLKPGFHMNRATKTMAITRLNAALRDHKLVERDSECCNELSTYRSLPGGGYSAVSGCHDDLVITRALACTVIDGLGDGDAYRRFMERGRPKGPRLWRVIGGALRQLG